MRLSAGLLIASPQMEDPRFARAVILLLESDHRGSLGVVINKPSPYPLARILKGLDTPTDGVVGELLWGGPVEPGVGFVIWRGEVPTQEGWQPGDGLAVSPSRERLLQLAAAREPFCLALGYAGWSTGQLEQEVESGSWVYIEADASLIFAVGLPERYDEALQRLGVRPEQLWMTPVDE